VIGELVGLPRRQGGRHHVGGRVLGGQAAEVVDHRQVGGDAERAVAAQEVAVRRREAGAELQLGGGDGVLGHRAGDDAAALDVGEPAPHALDQIDEIGLHGSIMHGRGAAASAAGHRSGSGWAARHRE
jgi:hypothetical protein